MSTTIGGLLDDEYFMGLPAPVDRGVIEVDYCYTAQNTPGPVQRRGTWKFEWNRLVSSTDLDFGDDFTYIGNSSLLNALEFRATLGGSKITIEAKNLTLDEGIETDEFKFTLTYKF